MTDNGFIDYILDILSRFGNIKLRRMFGGYGIYKDKIIFAIIINNELYFKADSILAEKYKLLGSCPFSYKRKEKTIALSYWLVPPEVLEDSDRLKGWFNSSLSAAISNKKNKL